MDVTPLIPADRQVIESYGAESFRVSGVAYQGAIIVFPDATVAWQAAGPAEVTWASLAPVTSHGGVEILLIGCGKRMIPIPRALRQQLRDAGIVVDTMDTGAACRTYNVLLAEDRRVAAALLPNVSAP
jgi:uncharacterized protein